MNLTHWGRVACTCASKLNIIASDNGLSSGRRQAIIWNTPGILLIWPIGTYFIEMLIEIHTFSFKKIHMKISSVKSRPFYFDFDVLNEECGNNNKRIIFRLTSYLNLTEGEIVWSSAYLDNEISSSDSLWWAHHCHRLSSTHWCGDLATSASTERTRSHLLLILGFKVINTNIHASQTLPWKYTWWYMCKSCRPFYSYRHHSIDKIGLLAGHPLGSFSCCLLISKRRCGAPFTNMV